MKIRSMKKFAAVAVALGFVALPQLAGAQAFPTKPMRLIIPFAPGGSTDIAGRLIAADMEKTLGQPVVVENRAGAAGAVGIEAVVRAEPDGYTMGLSGSGPSILLHITGPKPTFTTKDIAWVGNAGLVELMFITRPGSPYTDLKAMIAAAKAAPGKLPYAHGGTGSPAHLAMEYLKSMAGIDMQPIVYKGDGALMTDVMGGQVDAASVAVASAAAQIKAGKIKALAVGSAVRSPSLPDVPTVAEAGIPGYEAATFNILVVRAGTPNAIIDRLNFGLNEAFKKQDIREKFVSMGMVPGGGTPKQAADFIERETAKWAKVIRDAKITVQ